MRELIRLLSSRLPVGKIPGIWEFIFPLFFTTLSPLLVFIASTLCATKSKSNHQSILYTHLALCLLLTTTTTAAATTAAACACFPSPAHSASSSVIFERILSSCFCIISHLGSSGSLPHPPVIMSSMHPLPASVLQPSHPSLLSLVSSTPPVCFYKIPM